MKANPASAWMPQVFTYADASELLTRTRGGKLGANTTIRADNSDIVVRLYGTDILRYHTDNSVTLNSGGHRTATTKARINAFLSPMIQVWSERGIWVVGKGERPFVAFFDGIRVYPKGQLPNPEEQRGGVHVDIHSHNPGKFADTIEELVYNTVDQQLGSVDEHGWFGLVSGMTIREALEAADAISLELSNDDIDAYDWPLNAIIREDSQGFIDMTAFKNNRDAIREWRRLEREYGSEEE